nr:unnamed protein product [Callosobruchus analis]
MDTRSAGIRDAVAYQSEKIKCSKCRECNNEPVVYCDSCERAVHTECSELSASELKVMSLKNKRTLKYFCEDCLAGVRAVPSLIKKIDEFQTQIEDLKLRLSSPTPEQHLTLTKVDEADIIMEMQEQQARKNNIMIFNLAETREPDSTVAKNIFRELTSQDMQIIATSRVGKKNKNDHQALKGYSEDSSNYRGDIKKKLGYQPITVYYQNAGGIRTKVSEIRKTVECCDYTVIVIVETWLNRDFFDGELGLKNYDIFRTDRDNTSSTKIRGGGVMIAVKKSLAGKHVVVPDNDLEQVFIQVKSSFGHILFGAVYIPPSSDTDVYVRCTSSVDYILNEYTNSRLCLLGDFNIPDAIWCNDDFGIQVNCQEKSAALILQDCFSYYNLFQVNNIPNSRGVMLDLVFSSFPDVTVSEPEEPIFPNSIHHSAINFDLKVEKDTGIHYEELYYDFKNADYFCINNYLASVDWNTIITNDINSTLENFYTHLYHIIGLCVPLKHPSQCREVRRAFPDDIRFEIMRQKGVFPYSYLTDMEKFQETALPPKECFYDELRDAHISQADYNRACTAWSVLGCKTLGDYSDKYLTSDVLLLADVFENYRELCLKTYRLDPAHYYTALV